MRVRIKSVFYIVSLWIMIGCSSPEPFFEDFENVFIGEVSDCKLTEGWLVPPVQVVGGGVGKDGIPSLENPTFIPLKEVDFLDDDDLAVGIEVDDKVRVFPHKIIDRHEIVNDQIGNLYYTLTFCPLTGSTVSLNRSSTTTFGVSGLLHNSNLVYYNRKDESFWSQMRLVSIHGSSVCEDALVSPHLEMTWAEWRKNFPEALVLSNDTGYDRDYATPAFSAAIREDNTPLWPYSPKDDRLKNYAKVLVTFAGGQPKVYPLSAFSNGGEIQKDNVNGREIIVIADPEVGMITAFYNSTSSNFELVKNINERVIVSNGSKWNLFGEVKEGVQESLEVVPSYIAYWFSVGAMFPKVEIFNINGD